MTRINVVPVTRLCDQHLLAEHRELTRIPNTLRKKSAKQLAAITEISPHYILGTGHVRFFYTRLYWLFERYHEIQDECVARNFKTTWKWPVHDFPDRLWNDYTVTNRDLVLNAKRIVARKPKKPRQTKHCYKSNMRRVP
jgi:deoxyribonuclease (pyrimidine dimer)